MNKNKNPNTRSRNYNSNELKNIMKFKTKKKNEIIKKRIIFYANKTAVTSPSPNTPLKSVYG